MTHRRGSDPGLLSDPLTHPPRTDDRQRDDRRRGREDDGGLITTRENCTGCVSCSETTPSQTAHLLPQRAENGLRGRRGQGRHKSQICVVAVFSPSGTHTSVCVVAEVV